MHWYKLVQWCKIVRDRAHQQSRNMSQDAPELTYIHFCENDYDTIFCGKVHNFLQNLKSSDITFLDTNAFALMNSYESCSVDLQSPSATESLEFLGPCELIRSPKRHCRQRVRFQLLKIFNQEESCSQFRYAMWDHGGPNVVINEFPLASKVIFDLMPDVLEEINVDYNCGNQLLSTGLQAVSFLSSTLGEVVMTLIYDRDILVNHPDGWSWEQSATSLKDRLIHKQSYKDPNSLKTLNIIGRSKGRKIIIGINYVHEHLNLSRYDGRTLRYKQVDDGFSNPNGIVNMKALDWLCHIVKEFILPQTQQSAIGPDLLEMYCGNGNHTVALAGIMAVEINDKLCDAAKENFLLNNISNVRIKACNSSKFANHILNYQTFSYRSSLNGDAENNIDSPMDFSFGTVMVDPPRAGLDPVTLKAVTNFDNIIYISCNPKMLLENLWELAKTHEITKLAAFDHFAYTNHLEVGILLQRRTALCR